MAYLVTGGTGFIGSYVVRDLLDQGKEVVCLQRSGMTPVSRLVFGEGGRNKLRIVQGDVSNALQVFDVIRKYDIELIVHLGYILLSGGISETQPAYALQVNCVGTNNLLEAARLFGLRKVIWTSSIQAFGRVSEFYREPIRDDDGIYMPDTMYGATKVLNELMTKLYFEKFGVDSIGFRLGITLGIGKLLGGGGAFTKFLNNVALGVPVTMAATDANRTRYLSYVENISDLIVKACDAPKTKTRIFNAVEYQCSSRQLVEMMRKVNPKAQVTIEEGVENKAATLGGTPEPMLDTSGVKTELGWKPKYSLEEAITMIFNYFRQQEGLSPLSHR